MFPSVIHRIATSLQSACILSNGPLSVFLLPVCIARLHSLAGEGAGRWPQIIRQQRNSGTLYTLFYDRQPLAVRHSLLGKKPRLLWNCQILIFIYSHRLLVVHSHLRLNLPLAILQRCSLMSSFHLSNFTVSQARLWIEKTNVLVDNEDDISRNLKSLGATEIANAVRKKSLAGIETAIRFFETQPRRERDPDR